MRADPCYLESPGQTGYNSDLAQYYRKVRSYGIQAEIGSF